MDDTLSDLVRASWREAGGCDLPPDLDAVESAVALLLDFVRARGAGAEVVSAIELAVVEGLNNAVRHGCSGEPGARVTLRWELHDSQLRIAIGDPGRFAPGPAWALPPADPLAESGRGGYLMHSLMDEVSHENGSFGHLLRLRKRLGPLRAPADAASLERELAAMTQDLSDTYESLAALFSLSELLATTPEFPAFLSEVLARLRTLVGADKAYVRIVDADGNWHLGGKSSSAQSATPQPSEPSPLERKAWSERREQTVRGASHLPEGDPLASMGAGGFICLLTFGGQPLGLLAIGRSEGDYFSAGQLNLVRTVADYLAIACATSDLQQQREAQQRMAREVQIAASIQQSLLPRRMPTVAGWQIAGRCLSAHEVGGDFFDVIDFPGEGFLVVIADVMGKGLPAALLATIFRTAVRARPDLKNDPGRLLTLINRQLHPDLEEVNMFITAQIAWFEVATARLRVANAGQGDFLRLPAGAPPAGILPCGGGMPVGIVPDHAYDSEEFAVGPGDVLLFLTDGLYEIERGDGGMLGLDGLASLINPLRVGDAVSFVRTLLESVSSFDRDGQRGDDRTLVVIQREPLS